MDPEEVIKPLALFGIVLIAVVALTAIVSLSAADTEAPPPDGSNVQGQSPSQYQPDAVDPDVASEGGEITVDSDAADGRILVDSRHGNQLPDDGIARVSQALFEAGYSIEVGGQTAERGFNATLERFDAVLIVQPTTEYTAGERKALREYADRGGRVVVLADAPSLVAGRFSTTTVDFGANNLTAAFGTRLGTEELYNLDDAANDNNYESIYASPVSDGVLTEGVETVTFDTATSAVIRDGTGAQAVIRAAEGTTSAETRRVARYPTVVRNGNFTFVTDASFMQTSEIYDEDNEVFVGNLLEYMLAGDAPDGLVQETPTPTPAGPPGPGSGVGGGSGGSGTPAPPTPPATGTAAP